jgi:hypothetical protein
VEISPVGGVMLRKLVLLIVPLLVSLLPLYSQQLLFSETIPMQGHIELQESFSLEVRDRIFFELSREMAGTTHEVATYQFFSNSPDIAYRLRLSPGYPTRLGEGIFAFRSVSDEGGSSAPPIPFKLTVMERGTQYRFTDEAFQEVQKPIGMSRGVRAEERGIIYVTFPTVEEGFDLSGFTFGAYEASVAVEVSAD